MVLEEFLHIALLYQSMTTKTIEVSYITVPQYSSQAFDIKLYLTLNLIYVTVPVLIKNNIG